MKKVADSLLSREIEALSCCISLLGKI